MKHSDHSAVLIFPHQLFKKHPALLQKRLVFLLEHPRFFSEFFFHKQKLMLHRASMKWYQDYLKSNGHTTAYIQHSDTHGLERVLAQYQVNQLDCATLDDTPLENKLKKFCAQQSIRVNFLEGPAFLSSLSWLGDTLGDSDHYLMNSFYIAQRKNLNILMAHGKPSGGKWSFDKENRQKLTQQIRIPEHTLIPENEYVAEARIYVETFFKKHPGKTMQFCWPTNHAQANRALTDFLHTRLRNFGPYQDAIDTKNHFLFHSLLSSSLNCGLLTPEHVITSTLEYAREYHIPINSLEGFIRQIIGWREFVRGIYLIKGEEQRKKNFFNHTHSLSESFWNGTTGIAPLDSTINNVIDTAYAHHIERLMVLGNFMLLTQTDPHSAYTWFMEFFIDAYDWVMVPNIYGMSQYADGGLMTTKPYFSGSNYILKMSNYKRGNWCKIWDALYWNFVYTNKNTVAHNPRLSTMAAYLKRIDPHLLKNHITLARDFLKSW